MPGIPANKIIRKRGIIMRFEIIGKNISVTPAMREQIEKKLSTLERFVLIDADTVARVVVRTYPNNQKVEVTIPTRIGQLRTEVEDTDVYAAVNRAVDKLQDQLRRQKTRLEKNHRDSLAKAFLDEARADEEEEIPVRTKTIAIEELDLDEAIAQMELSGHDFYVYIDEETKETAVVYRRDQGGYGLIEIER